MHRHSLGSPATKPQPAGGEGGSDEIEQEKRIRWCPRADRSIHLIPLLTLLCLLIWRFSVAGAEAQPWEMNPKIGLFYDATVRPRLDAQLVFSGSDEADGKWPLLSGNELATTGHITINEPCYLKTGRQLGPDINM
ncbi:hypothetical protein ZIOFF_036424 [Zingiber officinale]|uniref:Uncharacterized protein n=1 Tax=Zingiber officinale TaxID=94328 RepID=A0A8J5GEG7_ZINOF|nr:hypothetical protein ZIOFF_036424 [Zingiber officinale]